MMEKLWLLFFLLFPFVLIYLLYLGGFVQLKFTRAVGYIGCDGNSCKNYHKASVECCSGYLKRVLKFKQDGELVFSFNPAITAGTVKVDVLDSNKNTILSLDDENRTGKINVKQNEKYRLVILYDKANGSYEVNWNGTNQDNLRIS